MLNRWMKKTVAGWMFVAVAAPAIVGCATDDQEPALGDNAVEQFGKVHLKGGPRSQPVFSDSGLTLASNGDLAGLGNADLVLTLTALAQPTATCTNPSGASQPPGQNPAEVSISGAVAIPAAEIRNGTLHFAVATSAPEANVAGAPECPNQAWSEKITDMAFKSGTISVEQPVGTPAFSLTCTFTPITRDGLVPTAQVSCN